MCAVVQAEVATAHNRFHHTITRAVSPNSAWNQTSGAKSNLWLPRIYRDGRQRSALPYQPDRSVTLGIVYRHRRSLWLDPSRFPFDNGGNSNACDV